MRNHGRAARPVLVHQVATTRRYASELDEETTRWALEGAGRVRRQSMRRKGSHQPVMIGGSKRQRAVRGERRGTTNVGASSMRRAGRSRVMTLHRGYATVLVVLVPSVTGVHVPGVCRVSVSLGEQPDRCAAVVMDARHRDYRQGLPGQHKDEQHYRKLAYRHRHGRQV